jgi:hypothetical protein
MDAFALLSLVFLPLAFLLLGVFRQRIVRRDEYWKAVKCWLIAMILYYPVSELFFIGVFLSYGTRPAGFVMAILTVYRLCVALFPEAESGPAQEGIEL